MRLRRLALRPFLALASLLVPPAALFACGEDVDPAPTSPGRADGAASGDGASGGDGGGGGDADAGPFTKVLDLDAIDDLKGQAEVSTWLDRSGKDNTAAAVSGPLPVEPAIYGKLAVAFDGTKHMVLADSESLDVGEKEFLIEVVVRFTHEDTPTGHVVFMKQLAADPFTGPALIANHAFKPGEPTDRSTTIAALLSDGTKNVSIAARAVPPPDDKPHLVAMRRLPANVVEIRVDRKSVGAKIFTSSDFGAAGAGGFLGGDGRPGRGLKGHIGAVQMYRGAVPDREVSNIESRLSSRYLTPPPDAGADAGDGGDGG